MYYAEFGGSAEICIVPDLGVSQMVSEPWFLIPEVVSIQMVIGAGVRKACRITLLTVVVFRVSKLFW